MRSVQGLGWKEHAGCRRHILSHGKGCQYICGLPLLKDGSICNFSTNHSATMFAHKRGGKHERPRDYKFECYICFKRFPLRQGLDRHLTKHSPKKSRKNNATAAKDTSIDTRQLLGLPRQGALNEPSGESRLDLSMPSRSNRCAFPSLRFPLLSILPVSR